MDKRSRLTTFQLSLEMASSTAFQALYLSEVRETTKSLSRYLAVRNAIVCPSTVPTHVQKDPHHSEKAMPANRLKMTPGTSNTVLTVYPSMKTPAPSLGLSSNHCNQSSGCWSPCNSPVSAIAVPTRTSSRVSLTRLFVSLLLSSGVAMVGAWSTSSTTTRWPDPGTRVCLDPHPWIDPLLPFRNSCGDGEHLRSLLTFLKGRKETGGSFGSRVGSTPTEDGFPSGPVGWNRTREARVVAGHTAHQAKT
eukprot:scaffold764_cov363-Pavlova_lutheri.AAC.5